MQKKDKVIVAMSGGVDSSLVAFLLLKAGYEVSGLTMLLFDEGRELNHSSIEDAKTVADFLGISHQVVDFRTQFSREVIEPFIDIYTTGKTPNPCVICNNKIKFGMFFDYAMNSGANYMATGHYARIIKLQNGEYTLRKGLSKRKDQSYVLYSIRKNTLANLLFPLGEMEKEEVRDLAEKVKLPVAKKKESQEICFIPKDDYVKFLLNRNPTSFKKGSIVTKAGKVLGVHAGLARYTIGQRRGLGIATGEPLYVLGLDTAKNQVVVGSKNEIFQKELVITDTNWLIDTPKKTFRAKVKIRYGKNENIATIKPLSDECFQILFDEKVRAVTKGQAAVIYQDDRVLGGGIIS